MIDVMENIKKLSAALDAETASLHPSGKLLLLGSQDSVFLKAIKRKADQLGINCDHTSNPLPPYRGIVVDSETVSFNSILDPDVDIDHSYSPGMSAVSQAVMDLLIESGLVWEKDITIVGRGHAVKELAKYLDFNNATVTVAHSKTKSLLQATQNRDVVIYATPIITQDISYNTRDLVIDLGNSVPHPDRLNCPYVNRIGQLKVDERYYLSDDKVAAMITPPRSDKSVTPSAPAEEVPQTTTAGTCSLAGVKLSKKGTQFEGYCETALTLLARDYKGFGNQQMTGVMEHNE